MEVIDGVRSSSNEPLSVVPIPEMEGGSLILMLAQWGILVLPVLVDGLVTSMGPL